MYAINTVEDKNICPEFVACEGLTMNPDDALLFETEEEAKSYINLLTFLDENDEFDFLEAIEVY